MKTTFDLTGKENKVNALHDFLNTARNELGGVIMYLIIPTKFTDLMFNVSLERDSPDVDFYQYGWYNEYRFAIYIDKTLDDNFYLICNMKNMKVHLLGWS